MPIELPPPELRLRVAGTDDADWFDLSRRMAAHDLGAALERAARRLTDYRSILDFGCGCGRITGMLLAEAPRASIAATDIDAEAIGWVRAHMPAVDARVGGARPPLDFRSRSFDLVVGWSVF